MNPINSIPLNSIPPNNRINALPDSGTGAGLILMDLSGPSPRVLLMKSRRDKCWCFVKGRYVQEDRGYSLNTAVRKTTQITGLINVRDYRIIGRQMKFGKRMYWIGILNAASSGTVVRPQLFKYSDAIWADIEKVDFLNNSSDVRHWLQKGTAPNGMFQKTLTSWRQLSTH
jgi:hypothetical protein